MFFFKSILRLSFLLFFLMISLAIKAQSILEKAQQSYNDKEWESVIIYYNFLTESSPFNGDFHYRIARANFMTENYQAAIKHFNKAIAYGISSNNGYAYYYLSRIEARLNNQDKSYFYLSKSIDYSPDYISIAKREKDFEKFAANTKFKELFGIYDQEGIDIAASWRTELMYLKNRMELSHYDLFHFHSKEKWDSIITSFYNEIPSLNTNQILTRFSEIAAFAMDSHTYANPIFGNATAHTYHMLPIEFYFFGEKLYIRATADDYANLLGTEVTAIGKTPIQEVYQTFLKQPVTGLDNDFQLKWQLPWFLRSPELLWGKEIISTADFVEIEGISTTGKKIKQKIYPNEQMNFSVMSSTASSNWKNMNQYSTAPLPLYLRHPDLIFWMETLDSDHLLYIQINNIRDKENESMADFSDRFLEKARAIKAKALILDVRLNNGGNAHLGRALVKKLLKSEYNNPNKLFIIVGRNTFSATMPPIAALDKWSDAIFVGEPTGTRPNFIAEGNLFQLPYSKMYASVSNNYWQGGFNSNDSRKWIAPELGAAPNVEDYKNNIDPSLERIKQYLRTIEK